MTKELTMANMKLSFQTFGVSEKDYLSVQELQEVLQRMGGDAFDQEIFE